MWIMISGPYTAGGASPAQRQANLDAMNLAAYEVFRKGHTPIIGVNLALPIIRAVGEHVFHEVMMPVSLAAAERCDAVVRIGGPSKGADDEVAIFTRAGKPVYRAIEEIPGTR